MKAEGLAFLGFIIIILSFIGIPPIFKIGGWLLFLYFCFQD